ncbi:MAG: hypothetical protein WAV16_01255 [Candidatus Moraniibacteriota bacterium]
MSRGYNIDLSNTQGIIIAMGEIEEFVRILKTNLILTMVDELIARERFGFSFKIVNIQARTAIANFNLENFLTLLNKRISLEMAIERSKKNLDLLSYQLIYLRK